MKTRTTETTQHRGRGWIQANVRSATFRERHDFVVLVALVDKPTASLVTAWLVPSSDFAELAMKVREGHTLRMAASVKETSEDKWSPHRLSAAGLAVRVLEWLKELDGEKSA